MIKPLSMIIFGQDAEQRSLTRMQLISGGKVNVVAESSDYAHGLDLVKRYNPDSALLITNGKSEASLDLAKQLAKEHPSTVIVCTGTNCLTETVIKFFRAGASEFLMQPPSQAEMKEVLEKIVAARATADQNKQGEAVIACYSYRGGSGSTTLSVNLAATLAHTFEKPTTIVDLNLQQGTAPIFLGVKPVYSIADVAHNQDRLDAQLLKSFHTPVSDNLYCLASPLKVEEADDVEPSHIELLLSLLRGQFAYVIVDCQHFIDATTVAALQQADTILLVTLLDMASIYTTKRTLEIFHKMGLGDDKVRIVVNRYVKDPDVPLDKVEQVFGHRIHLMLADDYRAALSALNLGSPLVSSQPKSPLVKQYIELAHKITGREATPKKGWKGGFSFFGK
ncbi:MAG: AAA family ATPase [Acidobacteria bacterium]|nr:AAA family ATPase [Acidobacteriota bacterium]